MLNVKFRGKRVDGMGWITGQLFIPDKLLINAYICPETNYANFAPSLQDGDNLQDEMAKGMSIGLFLEVEPSSIGMSTGLYDSTKFENLTLDEQAAFLSKFNQSEPTRKNTSKDWKGKEIFGAIGEKGGDIVISKHANKPLHIQYSSSLAAFIAFETSSYTSLYKHQLHYFGEIIGNATDNHELLEN